VPGFLEVVSQAWNASTGHLEPFQNLFAKLKGAAKGFTCWSRGLFSKTKILLHAALIVILQLDIAQESRHLSSRDHELRASLKRRVVVLAMIERARKKQCAILKNVKKGDANTKFFHRRVNARRQKNHIHRIKRNGGWVTDHEQKEEAIHGHFTSTMGRGLPREQDLNWANLNFGNASMEGIDAPFLEDEVHAAICQLPSDKAPGPDGFTGAFFKKCWPIIKFDVMRAILQFNNLHVATLHWVNSANIVLLPKKEGAEEINDYRPISLIHAIAKIIAKMIASRLTPLMDDLVSNAQSAFIKKRSIHDNFLYVRNLARRLHKSKCPTLLFKLDIRKAFDSVRWEFLLELLKSTSFRRSFEIGLPLCFAPQPRESS
jgi:hypothetical protein